MSTCGCSVACRGLSSKRPHSIGDDLLVKFDSTLKVAHPPISQFSGGMRCCFDLAASLITQTRADLPGRADHRPGTRHRTRGQMWDTIRDLAVKVLHHFADHPVPR